MIKNYKSNKTGLYSWINVIQPKIADCRFQIVGSDLNLKFSRIRSMYYLFEPPDSDVPFPPFLVFLVVGSTFWLWWKEREVIRSESIKMRINKSVKRKPWWKSHRGCWCFMIKTYNAFLSWSFGGLSLLLWWTSAWAWDKDVIFNAEISLVSTVYCTSNKT